jgi:DNA-binding response OmpR family regulator
MKMLIVEDNPELLGPMSMTFKLRWPDLSIVHAGTGGKGVELAETELPDVIILDINLPDMDGYEVLRQIRLFSDVPVLFLTVRGDEMDRVRGLEMGADDYIVKPFSALELLARVHSAMRRGGREHLEEGALPFVSGGLTINFSTKEVMLENNPVHLTSTEYQLLYHLVRNEGRFVDHHTLETRIWGQRGVVENSVLRRYIYQLRHKLNDKPPRIIVSEIGKGYKFVRPVDRKSSNP